VHVPALLSQQIDEVADCAFAIAEQCRDFRLPVAGLHVSSRRAGLHRLEQCKALLGARAITASRCDRAQEPGVRYIVRELALERAKNRFRLVPTPCFVQCPSELSASLSRVRFVGGKRTMPGDCLLDRASRDLRVTVRAQLLRGLDQDHRDAFEFPEAGIARILARIGKDLLESCAHGIDLSERNERANLVAERAHVLRVIASGLLRGLELTPMLAQLM